MAISNFHGHTFVAFLDISGFKDLMRNDNDALVALRTLYQAGYDVLQEQNGVQGFFVSDSGILFVRNGTELEKLTKILNAIKSINKKMLVDNYMLTTSIAYGVFDYQDKLEFEGIEKNPIYGNAYVKAFLDNEKGSPKIKPGQCRLVNENLPFEIDLENPIHNLLKSKAGDRKHLYFYWNVENRDDIEQFEKQYTDSYQLRYSGMLKALKSGSSILP